MIEISEAKLSLVKEIAGVEFSQPYGALWGVKGFKSEFENKFAHILTALKDGKVIGFISVRAVADTAELLNLAVLPVQTKKGAASKLLDAMFNRLKNLGVKTVTLEVNETNLPAVNLYKKFGFKVIGKRGKFYNGVQDALLMKADL
ncbi:Ribosomal-protein-alanine acetyltransferase [Elusimicrobium minutum Pei191]|uniref:[Ribosomal protein bS18]-alanine N-acetyltransferase n=1 Tax=Elusimicrobium minutum (strain Pei191) TaxID=445932 RepID=B2KDW1_ELUMP|nr:ribosomal protein S18-alanine N-acetyltransferase [Elusimicrobium minutum]ACC98707.1 Ribosomal-protein-alanine acetyltransferase [Elusimicrobium minutum Pei191]